MNRINILFDSKILIDQFLNASAGRSGVFFVAWNVLQNYAKNKNIHITLAYLNEYEGSDNLRKIKKNPFFSQFKFVNIDVSFVKVIMQRIEKHKKNNNYIKILYNYCRLAKYKIYQYIFIKMQNIYISPYYAIPQSIIKQEHIKKFYILYDTIPIIFREDTENARLVHSPIINTFNKEIYSFCISQSCKNDYLKYCSDKLDANKMFVIYIAANQHYVPNYNKQELIKILKKYGIEHNQNDKYLFSLCSLEPRKNLPFTIACFCKFVKKHNIQDLYFYLGGGAYTDNLLSVLEKSMEETDEFRQKIKLLGYIDDTDINILYSNSLFFTFLSQYEGFGMPPLEAMQAGTPVITSNNSSLPEVVGDAAVSLTYNDEDAVINAFENFYFNENLRKEYIIKGLERAKMFSWEKCTGQMIKIIEEIVKCSE